MTIGIVELFVAVYLGTAILSCLVVWLALLPTLLRTRRETREWRRRADEAERVAREFESMMRREWPRGAPGALCPCGCSER